MAAPSTLTITYSGGSPIDFTLAVRNIFLNGGFWYVSATGVQNFVPWNQITSVTAQ